MLHSSLIELSEQAPRCADTAMLRGVLAEATDLARNAADHDTDATDIASWFSSLLRSAFASPAVQDLTDGAQLMLTGAVGRDDALPSSPLTWLAITREGALSFDAAPLAELLTGVGYQLIDAPWPALSRSRWLDCIAQATEEQDAAALGWLYDAGGWFGQAVVAAASLRSVADVLLADAVHHRPPAVQVNGGLPARDVEINMTRDLTNPVTRLTRWAGIAAGYSGGHTRERLEHARRANVLTLEETTSLAEAWRAGHTLRLQRWMAGVESNSAQLADMPLVQRSTFGASCRSVADVTRAVSRRYGVSFETA